MILFHNYDATKTITKSILKRLHTDEVIETCLSIAST